ncbi:MAG: hypothetical protein FWC68_00400 [Oscillospiraceae bacterium]|nr:hypothetical protein [Oscillospiraceae bacterium]
MENASKALIIAGAILLAILLISIGIMVFNAATAPVDQGADIATGQTATMFNSPWEAFGRRNQNATQVRQLMNQVNSHNRQNANNMVLLQGTGIGPTNPPVQGQFTFNPPNAGAMFGVTFTHHDNGFINNIIIGAPQ